MMITDNHSIGNLPYNFQLQHGFAHLLSGTTIETLLPVMYEATTNLDFFKKTAALLTVFRFLESGLEIHISTQIQHQHLEIDRFLAFHTEKMRVQIEERRKKNSRTIIAALEEGMTQRLREKEEEIVKMAKLNWALEEKIKSLCMENQIWRELAQTNEAKANALRSNLKQVLEQVVNDDFRNRNTAAGEDKAADDAQSCCESNNEEVRTLAEQDSSNSNLMMMMCKNCRKIESRVLLLPCRHLCLCTVCASSVNICPICKSTNNITIHVQMS
ncbi:unnamed protein product [Lactuca virosa]|uniref:RING-type domain-containing protein n=1 Tax=Lactuca virosa TaxID=75947 RepID=A0AAU9N088_9ASTR|nr:unnamed protein product [Lactuca virosa]